MSYNTRESGIQVEGIYKKFKAAEARSDDHDVFRFGPVLKIFAVVHRLNEKLYVTLVTLGNLSQDQKPTWQAWYDVDPHNNTEESWMDEFHRKLGDQGFEIREYEGEDNSDPWAGKPRF